MKASLRPRIFDAAYVLLALLVSTAKLPAHPFDNDGAGPAKAGSSNAQAYLYVEPFSCRVECLLWLPTALEMFDMPQGTEMLLSSEAKTQLIEKARATAAKWCTIKVNGVEQSQELTTATVLRGRPGATDTLKENEAIGVMDAMLGLTWECGAPADIKDVQIEWRKFTATVPAVPVTVSYGPIFEIGMVLNAGSPTGTWKNKGMLPPPKPLAAVPPVPEAPKLAVPLGAMLWIAIVGMAVAWGGWLSLKNLRRTALSLVAIGLGAAALWPVLTIQVNSPWGKAPPVTVDAAQPVLQALLRNTYRAFDQRDESAVYDVLARSISGDLLQRIYLQTAQALSLDAQDGTRVKVTDLAVDVDTVTPLEKKEGFVARGHWSAFGTVGHWGHMHQRVNSYQANMTVESVSGAWKLTSLEVLEEVRDFTKKPAAAS